jgi:hypothetical protein
MVETDAVIRIEAALCSAQENHAGLGRHIERP